jgi:hypothetical protein
MTLAGVIDQVFAAGQGAYDVCTRHGLDNWRRKTLSMTRAGVMEQVIGVGRRLYDAYRRRGPNIEANPAARSFTCPPPAACVKPARRHMLARERPVLHRSRHRREAVGKFVPYMFHEKTLAKLNLSRPHPVLLSARSRINVLRYFVKVHQPPSDEKHNSPVSRYLTNRDGAGNLKY